MSDYHFIATPSSVTFLNNDNNEPITINEDHENWREVRKLLQARAPWSDIVGLVSPRQAIEEANLGMDLHIRGGELFYGLPDQPSSLKLGGVVVERILEFLKDGLPHEPLANFIVKLYENPSSRSVEQLYCFLEKGNFPICEDGDFIAYKAVKADFTDKHTGTISNEVGTVVAMRRNQVNENPDHGCSYGLHAGSWRYATGFASGDDKLLMVKIQPQDVVSVPNEDHGKLRCCRYEVIGMVGDDQDEEIKDAVFDPSAHLGEDDSDDSRMAGHAMDDPTPRGWEIGRAHV